MKYLNKRTGNVIIVPCRLIGPDWEEITETKAEAAKTPKQAAPTKKAAQGKGKPKKGADA